MIAGGSIAADAPRIFEWQHAIAEAIRSARVDTVVFVPDGRLRGIILALEEAGDVAMRGLTREEECVAYAGGFSIAGGRTALLMQCSGIGNSLNAFGSFVLPYGIGIPLIISMRGTLGERNPAQVPMGFATTRLLDALGIPAFSARDPELAGQYATGVLTLALEGGKSAALLLEPELGGHREAD